ncbi:MAG: transglutaminase domain-containing protein, partial [Phycisphaerae bacterium]|nr:transglutaminase domain-containing protein [Phycisphaerae bacterium]
EDLLQLRSNAQGKQRHDLDIAIARRIAERLRSSYAYSLDLSEADRTCDGVDNFLFHMKKGHCEYFASALTVMCCALDVEARLATGFHADRHGADGGEFVVRNRDAHAWTEVFTPSTDWIIVDASPARRDQQAGGWWQSFSNFWTNLRFTWHEKVVGYDFEARRGFWTWLRRLASSSIDALASGARSLRDRFVNLLAHGHIDRAVLRFSILAASIGLILEGLLVFRLIRRSVRRRRWLRASHGVGWRELKFIFKLFKLLRKHGLTPRPDQTPLDLADEAADELHLPRDALCEIIELYYRVRWGKVAPQAKEIKAAENHLARITAMLST